MVTYNFHNTKHKNLPIQHFFKLDQYEKTPHHKGIKFYDRLPEETENI